MYILANMFSEKRTTNFEIITKCNQLG